MKILMVGRGVIATIYGWVLEKAGSKVEFFVRPGRAAQYGPSVNLEILDGRVNSKGTLIKQNWPITMIEDLTADHDYDLIIVSVNHNQLSDVITYLSSRIGKATVLIFNNIWVEPQTAVSALPNDQIVWGFPGGGGGFNAGTLKGGFMKLVFLGSIGGSNRTARYQAVRELFREAGLSVSEPKDFRGWLWLHFVLDAGLAAQALKVGGYSKLFSSTVQLKEAVLLIREMIPLLKAKGDKPDPGIILLLHLPASLLGFVVQKFLSREILGRFLMDQLELSGHASYELTSLYPRDVLADARRLGLLLPRLAVLEPVFK
ncbi:MAG: 2-dehydropantoate 2-reductase N-terminal domain-containing protein [Anaerolineaceae bacterium]|nr:2-dehydropantoate 2-reductase N-terminal domain-containing protein [Anaerolineaceae bacterium]